MENAALFPRNFFFFCINSSVIFYLNIVLSFNLNKRNIFLKLRETPDRNWKDQGKFPDPEEHSFLQPKTPNELKMKSWNQQNRFLIWIGSWGIEDHWKCQDLEQARGKGASKRQNWGKLCRYWRMQVQSPSHAGKRNGPIIFGCWGGDSHQINRERVGIAWELWSKQSGVKEWNKDKIGNLFSICILKNSKE